jgi:hypothetical protein
MHLGIGNMRLELHRIYPGFRGSGDEALRLANASIMIVAYLGNNQSRRTLSDCATRNPHECNLSGVAARVSR